MGAAVNNLLGRGDRNLKIDPNQAVANDDLKLSKEEMASYRQAFNNDIESGAKRRTLDMWAREQKRGIYAVEGSTPGVLDEIKPLKSGERYKTDQDIPAEERARIKAAKAASDLRAVQEKAVANPPDLTDASLVASRKAEQLRLMTGQGRKSTFLTGPGGLATPNLRRKSLLGG